jgi:phosphoenolpyruvate carboxykinase (ATP)
MKVPGTDIEASKVYFNPSFEELDELIAQMPNAKKTEFNNWNISTRVTARSKNSTFIASDEPEKHSDQTITREEYERVSKLQNDFISDKEMIVIDGYIGNDPEFRVKARLVIQTSSANIAAMQKTLYYPLDEYSEDYEPEVMVIYTPDLEVDGYPDNRLIAVDIENNITRVMNSDYFGESKKGGLRMWNKIVHDRGGIPLHAGCKIIPTDAGKRVGLIVGLSGTGKTTTTFTRQNESNPVQDDFIAWMPNGKVYATENGCFAKTFGLDPKFEPTIYKAVCQKNSYLENISMDENGKLDFFDTSYTKNGRAVFGMAQVDGAADASEIETPHFLLILNRNENIIPAVVKLNAAQAAGYFMLGETKGTSAGGKDEAGKSLRVPGTNPFFPLLHAMQGNRLKELLMKFPAMEVYLMNTGRVGGPEDDERSKKVKIPHSSAIVKGIAERTITWDQDTDFGYMIAKSVPGIDTEDENLLQPRKMYEEQGRAEEYEEWIKQLNKERKEYLKKWEGLDDDIMHALFEVVSD